jgi:hypothetical protein
MITAFKLKFFVPIILQICLNDCSSVVVEIFLFNTAWRIRDQSIADPCSSKTL